MDLDKGETEMIFGI